MNIRDAIYKAGEHGKIRLGEQVFEINTIKHSIAKLGDDMGYIFTAEELISLDWEAQTTEWVAAND